MIGVIANPADHDVIREFFELFKTPWEFHRPGRRYEVLLGAGDVELSGTSADLTLVYAGRRIPFDAASHTPVHSESGAGMTLLYGEHAIPIYGRGVTFRQDGMALKEKLSGQPAACRIASCERVVVRIGYDLFGEVRTLLTEGQPPANAALPTLDRHIAFLRNVITGSGVPLLEIPPVPDGHRFIACLTHDVDHPSIRQHKWDHTMFGFLYRALFRSLAHLLRGRMPAQDLLRNWAAAVKLPFVHLGLAKDFWRDFDDRYLELEGGLPSTFFVIPFKNDPGTTSQGPAPRYRAARYGARDLANAIRKLRAAGCAVGLHGIDAWRDSSRGREELEEIRSLTGPAEIGVRMHWLYQDPQTCAALEEAGAAYDSTMGYRETVGYRAGTTQVYKPLSARRLLELPLHVMDTALFYPDYLDLAPEEASARVGEMIENARHLGGVVTVNWHDRSAAPERLWGACYQDMIGRLKAGEAWFATAPQAVAWFAKRRAAVFETDQESNGRGARVSVSCGDDLPGLRLRIHNARASGDSGGLGSEGYVDTGVTAGAHARTAV